MAWPIGGQALPGSVRWIAAEAVVKTLYWPNEKMPSGEWAGTIAFSYGAGEALAWKLEALTAQGRPVQSEVASRGLFWGNTRIKRLPDPTQRGSCPYRQGDPVRTSDEPVSFPC